MKLTIKKLLKYSYFLIAFAIYIYFLPLINLMNESQSFGYTGNRIPNMEYILFIFTALLIFIISTTIYYVYIIVKKVNKKLKR